MTEVFSDLADLSGVAENTLLKVSKVSMQTKMVMKKFVCLISGFYLCKQAEPTSGM